MLLGLSEREKVLHRPCSFFKRLKIRHKKLEKPPISNKNKGGNMKQAPYLRFYQEYKDQGYNDSQAKSMAWAEYFEERMAILDQKYAHRDSFFGPEIRIDCSCKDCGEGAQLLPSTAMQFIRRHKHHKTKTIKIR